MMATSERLRLARVRAASTAFLRKRPWVVLVAAVTNAFLLHASGAAAWQRRAVGVVLATGLILFFLEALALRRREVGDRWLVVSLGLTFAGLAFAASLTGGLASPVLPLLLAPLVVMVGAFGRRRESLAFFAASGSVVVGLALAPPLGPAIPAPHHGLMAGVALAACAVLCFLAIAGLASAHSDALASLDALRTGAITEAATRARETEAVGAKVAHELRNPLTAIKALVQVVQRGTQSPKDQERLGVILDSIGQMEQRISDYLSLARPLTDLHVESMDLAALVKEVGALVEGRAADSNVQVTLQAQPAVILADPRRLREALLNLTANAIEAMPRGGSLIIESGRTSGAAWLRVRDTGTGIPPELVSSVGEPFTTTRVGGTGLGILLAKSVATLHGGSLEFDSVAGRGTTASIHIPQEGFSNGAHSDRG